MSLDRSWPDSLARRSRPPAVTKSQDLTKKTLQQLGSRTKAPGRVPKPGSLGRQQQKGKPYIQLYQDIISTDWQLVQPPPRQPLFSQPNTHAASTPALRAKLCPALDTTKDWRRVQRKILPKYLLVLDAVTAVHLLQCLARLQPPSVNAAQQDSCISHATDSRLDEQAQVLLQPQTGHQQHQQQQQLLQQRQQPSEGENSPPQHIQGPSLDQLAQLPTSVYSALAGCTPGVWPVPAFSQAQQAAADAAAVAAGFTGAAAARAEFDLMLSAVYTVLCAKLAKWPVSVLVKLLSCAGQLQLQHDGFLQALLEVSKPQLSQQPAPVLFACLEAMSRLHVQPPQHWWQAWEQAMLGQLPLLSLAQLAALQLHLSHLQLQPGARWSLEYQAAVLDKVTASSGSSSSSQQAGQLASSVPAGVSSPVGGVELAEQAAAGGAHSSEGVGQRGGDQDASKQHSTVAQAAVAAGAAATTEPVLTSAQTDVLCSVLCTCHLWSVAPPESWLSELLQLCTAACQQGCISTAGALQLLAACCCGACVQLRGTAAAQAACLGLLQQRMFKLPAPAGVAVLFACVQSGNVRQLPGGFAEALAQRLTDLLPELPTALLLQVPHVLKVAAAGQQAQDERLLAAYALVTQARLAELSWWGLQELLAGCLEAGWSTMPATWCADVKQQIDRCPQADSSSAAGARPQYGLGTSSILSVGGLLALMEGRKAPQSQ